MPASVALAPTVAFVVIVIVAGAARAPVVRADIAGGDQRTGMEPGRIDAECDEPVQRALARAEDGNVLLHGDRGVVVAVAGLRRGDDDGAGTGDGQDFARHRRRPGDNRKRHRQTTRRRRVQDDRAVRIPVGLHRDSREGDRLIELVDLDGQRAGRCQPERVARLNRDGVKTRRRACFAGKIARRQRFGRASGHRGTRRRGHEVDLGQIAVDRPGDRARRIRRVNQGRAQRNGDAARAGGIRHDRCRTEQERRRHVPEDDAIAVARDGAAQRTCRGAEQGGADQAAGKAGRQAFINMRQRARRVLSVESAGERVQRFKLSGAGIEPENCPRLAPLTGEIERRPVEGAVVRLNQRGIRVAAVGSCGERVQRLEPGAIGVEFEDGADPGHAPEFGGSVQAAIQADEEWSRRVGAVHGNSERVKDGHVRVRVSRDINLEHRAAVARPAPGHRAVENAGRGLVFDECRERAAPGQIGV